MTKRKALEGKPMRGIRTCGLMRGKSHWQHTPRRGLLLYNVLAAVSMLFVAKAASVVENVALEQDAATRTVKITYDLSGDPAIITFDILTNAFVAAQGASIGDAHLTYSRGDVNRLVQPGEHKTIWWQADRAWPDHEITTASVRPSVTAWPTNSPPLYLVVNLLENQDDQVRYYVSSNAIPGGLLESPVYRETHMVLRRIDARNVEWRMDLDSVDGPHNVTLQNNFYAAVFPVTQGQWYALTGARSNDGYCSAPRFARRPLHVSYNRMRESSNDSGNETYRYPEGPNPASVIGIVNDRTGLAFDLPSEAQWDYACRSGLGGSVWNNGEARTNDNMPGRHRNNGGWKDGADAPVASDEDWGTPVVGSYEPSKWGLYDMHGSLEEWCLDWYVQNSSTVTGCETGAVNTVAGTTRVTRGGSFNRVPYNCRSVTRLAWSPTANFYVGARLFMTLPSTDESPVSEVSSEPYALLASGRKVASSVARNVVFDPNAAGFTITFK